MPSKLPPTIPVQTESPNAAIATAAGDAIVAANAKQPNGSLKSTDFLTMVDILSEGEIEGSATASKIGETDKTSDAYKNCLLKDLFLNNQPVLQPDADINDPKKSDRNFDRVIFRFQAGTANNEILPAAELQSTEIQGGDIGQLVSFPKGGSATTRSVTITNTDVDLVRVRVKFDQFFKINPNNGNRTSTKVDVKITVNPNNGSQQTVITNTVKGKSAASYSRDYGIRLADVTGYNTNTAGQSGSFFPITVTLTRTNSEGGSNSFNAMRLGGVTEIIEDANSYPHVAHCSLRISSQEFPNLPSRVFRMRGKKVKIPNNATVHLDTGRLSYSGTWDGNFATDRKWTTDPAWILYDLLVYNSERTDEQQYGCKLPESSIDKYRFRKVSEYCGELVDDGDGGQEPRFSLNTNITTQAEALSVINDMCSVMRAMPYYQSGSIKISQDAPQDFANPNQISLDYVFNNANVVNGVFTYSGSSLKTRFTIINVSYFDLETQRLDYVTVKDTAAIDKYGVFINTLRTFGTTSRGQAQRVGKWFLNTQQNATETCIFETNIAAGSVLEIGDIIGIADRVKGVSIDGNIVGKRRGGLVKSATESQVVIDDVDNTNRPSLTDSPTISCLLSTGKVETRTISSYTTDLTGVNVTPDFSTAPVANSPYIFESGDFGVTTWRVANIKEKAKHTYQVTALQHNQNKYSAVEDGEQLEAKSTSILTNILPPPSSLTVQEKIVIINNKAVPKLFIDWETVTGASGYTLQYRRDDDNFTQVNTQESSFEIVQTEFIAGEYDIRLFTVNGIGQQSNQPLEQTIAVDALADDPEQPTNLQLEPTNNYQVKLTWDAAIALDVIAGGKCLIRHTTEGISTAKYSNSIDLLQVNGNTTDAVCPALAGTYSIKFEDLAGNLSPTEAKVEFALPETQSEVLIKQQREEASFNGTKTNLQVSASALELTNPASTVTGTYAQSAKTITVTKNSHNLVVGDKPQLTFTTGLSLDDSYAIVTVPDANTFTVTAADSQTTSGNVTIATGLLGRYEFASAFDLGAVYQDVRIKRHIKSEGFNINNNFDSIPSLDAEDNFDGEGSSRLKGRLRIQTSNDASTYTDFLNLTNGTFNARAFKFRSHLVSINTNENIKFSELGFDVSFPVRVENKYIVSGNTLSVPLSSTNSANGLDVVFASRFFTGLSTTIGGADAFLPSISITPYNLGQGGYFVIKQDVNGNFLNAANQNVNGTGFNIVFKNASNTVIDVKFSFQALGYGKGA